MVKGSERIIALYRRHAGAWAEARRGSSGSPIETAWLDRFISLLPPRPAVLDLGCGAGEPIDRYLIERGCDLTGIDTAPELLAIGAASLPRAAWLCADMRGLALGQMFDGILAWDSFFHLCPDDQRRMFAVFRAHAAPGAVLLFTSGPAHGVALGSFQGEPLYHASLDADEYRARLEASGFAVVDHAVEDPTCGHHTIWLARSG